jgi:hypothetical protein
LRIGFFVWEYPPKLVGGLGTYDGEYVSQPFTPLTGTGEIHQSPLLQISAFGDYHLKSQAGHWDANSASWVKDEVTSPCIDAGDPASPIGLEPFPNGGRIIWVFMAELQKQVNHIW